MKRLLIHAGYPKAASTTLQNGLFLTLHNDRRINFLGRAWESGFYGVSGTKKQYKSLLSEIMHPVAAAGDMRNVALGDLRENVVNVFSEGIFMNNEIHDSLLVMPERIRRYFSPVSEKIDVLLVIRNQRTLITSYYIQKYVKMGQRQFSDFIRASEQSGWSGALKIFNFYNVASEYARVFGKDNLHLVLFEDLVNNKSEFSEQIGRLTGVDAQIVTACLEKKHLNKTKKEGGVAVVEKLGSFSVRRLAGRALRFVGVEADRLLDKTIPVPADEDTDKIFARFKASNEKLAEAFSLDKGSMRKYGYF